MSLRSPLGLTISWRTCDLSESSPFLSSSPAWASLKQIYFHIIIEHEQKIPSRQSQLGVTLLVSSILLNPMPVPLTFQHTSHISMLTSTLIQSYCWPPPPLILSFWNSILFISCLAQIKHPNCTFHLGTLLWQEKLLSKTVVGGEWWKWNYEICALQSLSYNFRQQDNTFTEWATSSHDGLK